MKFKKLLGAVCSFLLATTSFLCGSPASAKTYSGKNFCVFMVNSGEYLGNGECDGDERDKACWYTITTGKKLDIIEWAGYASPDVFPSIIHYDYLTLNQHCPTAGEAMKYITASKTPEVFVVVANLAKNSDEVIADINEHFDDVLECQRESLLYSGFRIFNPDNALYGKEVYPDTVPGLIYGVVPEGMEQKTSNEEFVEIVKQIKRQRQGNGTGDGKFKYIHNEVIVRQSDGTHICINMDNNSEIKIGGIYQVIGTIAKDESLQPILWPNYHDVELPRRKAAEEEAIQRAQEEKEARWKARWKEQAEARLAQK